MAFEIQHYYDVLYVANSTVARHGLDAFWPTANGVYPAVICVHGGGWNGGGKEACRLDCDRIARYGFAAIAVNYKLAAPGAPSYPDALNDIALAVQWVKTSPACVNDNKVILYGSSSGGHLALLYAATHPGQVAGVVAVSPPCNLLNSNAWLEPYVETFLGQTRTQNPALWQAASPSNHISNATMPKTLLLTGEADVNVLCSDAVEMYELLRTNNSPGRIYRDLTGNHCLLNAMQSRDGTVDGFLNEIRMA